MAKRKRDPLYYVFKLRTVLAAIPLIVAVTCRWCEFEDMPALIGLGAPLFVAGLVLRIWAQQHLHYRLKVRKVLTLTGPYALVRNPIYIANLLIIAGLTFLSELVWLVPVAVIWAFGVYSVVITFEERGLFKSYGSAYADYVQETPRWCPKLSSVKAVQWSSDFLGKSICLELYNLLFVVPFILKDLRP